MNRVFTYKQKGSDVNFVASSVEGAIEWIESLGFKMNERTTENLNKVFGELQHHHYGWYFMGDCGPVEALKPVGIGQGYIKFAPTKCNTTKEYDEAQAAKLVMYDQRMRRVLAVAKEVFKLIDSEKKTLSVSPNFYAIEPTMTLTISWNGYWSDVYRMDCYLKELTIRINMDSLLTEEGLNVFYYLKHLKLK